MVERAENDFLKWLRLMKRITEERLTKRIYISEVEGKVEKVVACAKFHTGEEQYGLRSSRLCLK